jgi:anti-sigma B factor antagonist
MPLDIHETQDGSVVVLTLKGTLEIGEDTERLTGIVKSRLDGGQNQFLLDLAGVRYIDSSGITALIKIHTSARGSAGAMKLLRLTQRVHDVLQITRLSSVFEIYNDPAKAMNSFAAGPAGGGGGMPTP